jgi:hypothetical protein
MNFLEQLVSEWYEYNGYFLQRNIKVGYRAKGGYECELDIVGFHPVEKHLVHIEPSTDSHAWGKREARFTKKFTAGRKYIPSLFEGLKIPKKIEQIAVLGYMRSTPSKATVGGGKIMTVMELLSQIFAYLKARPSRGPGKWIPEKYPMLRLLQYVAISHKRGGLFMDES